jgi:hypothetical protein
MKLAKLAGATSEIWQIFIADSSSTTGGGLTGLVFNSASLTAYYHRDTDTTATAITLVTMTVGTFTSSGFKEIDATNMPGWYQFCPPNAALASGAKSAAFHLKGATNMVPLPIECQLTAYDPDNATSLGLSRLDAAVSSRMATFTLPTNFSALSITAGGLVDITQAAADKVWSSASRTLTAFSTALAVSVWDVLDANIATASSVGLRLKGLTFTTANKVDATIQAAGDFAQAAADKVWSSATRSLTDKAGFALSAAGVQAIWDALTSALTTASSIGKLLVDNINATISSRGTGTALTAVQVENAVWDAVRASHTTAGTFGQGAASVQGNVTGSVASVTGAVGSVAAGGITSASFGASAIDAAALATDAGQEIADRILARNIAGGSDAGRLVKEAMQRLRNRVYVAAATMHVTAADDTTDSWTAAVTTTAGNPISDIDPA